MNTLSRRLTMPAAAAAATLALSGCGPHGGSWYNTPRYTEDRTMTVDHQAGSGLSVVNANGSVSAVGDTARIDDVLIEARLHSYDTERLAFARLIADRTGDGTLDVRVEWPAPGRQNNEGATIRVYLPDADGLEVRTSNGSITTEGLAGHANLSSSNGRISVIDHRGDVIAGSSNGSVRAHGVEGPVDIKTSNGAVVVEHALAPVRVETSNGSIAIETADSNPGPVRARTSNGRVDLDLGTGFEGTLKISTSNAKINVRDVQHARLIESSKNYVELSVGDGDGVSSVRTSNGSVRVKGTEPSGAIAD
ncbi:MAG: DUF4097 family beta strand repeat-containing protein [Planctomycetota bacterium]